MNRFLLVSAACLLSANAFAGALDVSAPASIQTGAVLAPIAVAQKVYPPLPTLAMLPASANDDDDAPVAKTVAKKSRKTARRVVDSKSYGPEPRLVVSDDSRVYLRDIESKLDAALAR